MCDEIKMVIPDTKTEPSIQFIHGILKIVGKSIPTDSTRLNNKVIEAFYRYGRNPMYRTEVHIDLEFINSSSNRSLLNLLIAGEHMFKNGYKVEVFWYNNEQDELMVDQGKVFGELLSLPFYLVAKGKSDINE